MSPELQLLANRYLGKSKRVFKPKAPPRRDRTVSSTQASEAPNSGPVSARETPDRSFQLTPSSSVALAPGTNVAPQSLSAYAASDPLEAAATANNASFKSNAEITTEVPEASALQPPISGQTSIDASAHLEHLDYNSPSLTKSTPQEAIPSSEVPVFRSIEVPQAIIQAGPSQLSDERDNLPSLARIAQNVPTGNELHSDTESSANGLLQLSRPDQAFTQSLTSPASQETGNRLSASPSEILAHQKRRKRQESSQVLGADEHETDRSDDVRSSQNVAHQLNALSSAVHKTPIATQKRNRDQSSGHSREVSITGAKRRKNLREGRSTQEGRENNQEQAQNDIQAAPTGAGQPRRSGRKNVRRKRQRTPDDAEHRKIAPTEVVMSDLCVDTQQGKISSREMRLRERDKDLADQKKEAAQTEARRQLEGFMEDPTGSQPAAPEQASQSNEQRNGVASNSNLKVLSAPKGRRRPTTKVVEGRIVQIEDAHIIDRHDLQNNPNLAYNENATATVEDDLTKRINSATFSKRKSPSKWTFEMTQLFYNGLRYFGMDFQMLTLLFPDKSRHQLKLKFNKEQRADVRLIDQILKERAPIPSVEELQKMSGKVFRSTEEVYKELEQKKQELLESSRKEEEMAEEARKAREKEINEEGTSLGVDIAPREVIESDGDGHTSEDEHGEGIKGASALSQVEAAGEDSPHDSTNNNRTADVAEANCEVSESEGQDDDHDQGDGTT